MPERSGVTYRDADADYFAERGLRRFAGVWSLWALGVGAVISGDFSGVEEMFLAVGSQAPWIRIDPLAGRIGDSAAGGAGRSRHL